MPAPPSTLFRLALKLPKSDATWQLLDGVADGVGKDGGPLGAVVIADKGSGHARAARLTEGAVADAAMLGALRAAMLEPPAPLRPERPAVLEVEDEELARFLRKTLRLIGVRVEVADQLAAAEAAWHALVDEDSDPELLPPEVEVTLAPEVPAWLAARLPERDLAEVRGAVEAGAPWLVAWARPAAIAASEAAIADVTAVELWPAAPALEPDDDDQVDTGGDDDDLGVVRMARDTAWAPQPLRAVANDDDDDDDDADDEDGPLFADEPPALVAIDANDRHSALCWDAEPAVRDAFAAAARAAGSRALLVLAERHAEREPPAFATLRMARTVAVVIVADLPMPAEA
ncbi:MAG: hypothetical protein RIT45_2257 [Pseudomonadota bacterium]